MTEAETARARRQLRARLVFESDSVTNIAHQLGYFDTVAGPGFLSGLQAGIDGVTAAQVSDVARRRLARTDADRRLVPADRCPLMAIDLRTRALAGAGEAAERRDASWCSSTSMAPAVTIDCAFDAGSLYDAPDAAGAATWSAGCSTAAASAVRPIAIAEELDDRGVALRVTTTRHRLALSCTCLAEDFP